MTCCIICGKDPAKFRDLEIVNLSKMVKTSGQLEFYGQLMSNLFSATSQTAATRGVKCIAEHIQCKFSYLQVH